MPANVRSRGPSMTSPQSVRNRDRSQSVAAQFPRSIRCGVRRSIRATSGQLPGNIRDVSGQLTSLGICMFLGALKRADSNPASPDPLRLLVLDDVLIGLDISNRLPLLECLQNEFPHHQTILMTYDELWFNMAREHTEQWGNWSSAQLFAELTGPADPPIPRLKDTTDDLVIATRHLNISELRQAALYVRSAFENRLRTVCEDRHIKVEYKADAKNIKADTLWNAILARHADMVANGKEFLDSAIIPGIEATRSRVLNSLLHDGGVGLTRPDVQAAIDSLRRFRACRIPYRP